MKHGCQQIAPQTLSSQASVRQTVTWGSGQYMVAGAAWSQPVRIALCVTRTRRLKHCHISPARRYVGGYNTRGGRWTQNEKCQKGSENGHGLVSLNPAHLQLLSKYWLKHKSCRCTYQIIDWIKLKLVTGVGCT